MNAQANPSPNANPQMKWIWLGGLIAVLVLLGVAFGAYRSGQNNAPENAVIAPVIAPQASTVPAANAHGDSFAEAGKTWTAIEAARSDLDSAIKAEKLDQVHHVAFEIRDQVRRLPESSAALSETQRQELKTQVLQVDQLAQMLDEAGDSKNVQSTHQHHMALNDALVKVRGLYPAGVLPANGPMSGAMGDDKMKDPDTGMGGMTDDKMGGAMGDNNMAGGAMKDAPKAGMSGMGDGGMGGGMMGGMMDDDKMGGGGGMGMMDMMMSGMPAADKKPMKRMMDDMMAMPPAKRKQAMQKMTGPPMPGMGGGKSAMTGDATMKKLTAGMSASDAAEMKRTMGKMAAMPPAERKAAMQKMSDPPMPGGMGGGAMKDDAGDM